MGSTDRTSGPVVSVGAVMGGTEGTSGLLVGGTAGTSGLLVGGMEGMSSLLVELLVGGTEVMPGLVVLIGVLIRDATMQDVTVMITTLGSNGVGIV